MWKILKEAIDGKSMKSIISSMKFNDELITDWNTIGNKYNEFTITSIQDLIPSSTTFQIEEANNTPIFKLNASVKQMYI